MPYVEVATFTQHLSQQLIPPGTVRPGEDLVELTDRHVLVPEEVRSQLALRHVRRQRTHAVILADAPCTAGGAPTCEPSCIGVSLVSTLQSPSSTVSFLPR
jgi:hypothetical protein